MLFSKVPGKDYMRKLKHRSQPVQPDRNRETETMEKHRVGEREIDRESKTTKNCFRIMSSLYIKCAQRALL